MDGFYINLDYRTDRKEHFETYIKNYEIFNKINRFSAIKHDKGFIGVGLSHIEVLKKLNNMDGKYFLVFEDDFYIIKNNIFNNFCNDFEKIKNSEDWDLIILTPFFAKEFPQQDSNLMLTNNFIRINNVQTATGYVIKKSFIPSIIKSFSESVNNLALNKLYSEYAIDQHWKPLQNINNFYTYKYTFAGQKPSYSDIVNRYENYNGFLNIQY